MQRAFESLLTSYSSLRSLFKDVKFPFTKKILLEAKYNSKSLLKRYLIDWMFLHFHSLVGESDEIWAVWFLFYICTNFHISFLSLMLHAFAKSFQWIYFLFTMAHHFCRKELFKIAIFKDDQEMFMSWMRIGTHFSMNFSTLPHTRILFIECFKYLLILEGLWSIKSYSSFLIFFTNI